jgi:very-short-patch-repair endonuclease
LDAKEYIIRQLGKAKNKRYEAYVITRIVHLLNDFSLKFITQQYVSRPEGRALTDLFFPQLGLHIEVDEGQHFTKKNIIEDKIREADIINATGHRVLRIDVTKDLEEINLQIDTVITEIKFVKSKVSSFTPWDIDAEFNTQTYIDKGYIDISDNVAFKTIKDACNCFGHNYKGYQQAGASHPDTEIMLWFPKLFPNEEWDNKMSCDEAIIYEKNMDKKKAIEYVHFHLNSSKKTKNSKKTKRIVFAKVKGSLGDILYRFRGLYKLNANKSNGEIGLVWERIETKVNTYPSKIE